MYVIGLYIFTPATDFCTLSNGVRCPGGGCDFSALRNVQTGCGACRASCLVGTLLLPGIKPAGAWKLTTGLYLGPRLRKSGDITLLLLYAFMACRRTSLRLIVLNTFEFRALEQHLFMWCFLISFLCVRKFARFRFSRSVK